MISNEEIIAYLKKEREKYDNFHYKNFFYYRIIRSLQDGTPLTDYEKTLLEAAKEEMEAKKHEKHESIEKIKRIVE